MNFIEYFECIQTLRIKKSYLVLPAIMCSWARSCYMFEIPVLDYSTHHSTHHIFKTNQRALKVAQQINDHKFKAFNTKGVGGSQSS